MKTHRFLLVVAVALAATGAMAQTADTTALDPGTVSLAISAKIAAKPEAVYVSGTITVKSRLVKDPDFGMLPHVALSVDLSGVTAEGAVSGALYDFYPRELALWRPLKAKDTLETSILFYKSSAGMTTASTGQVSAAVTFDTTTGRLTSGTVTVGTTSTSSATATP